MTDIKIKELPNDELERAASDLIEGFKSKLKSACEEVIGKVYCDYLPHVESDAWMNYRNHMRDSMRGELIAEALSTKYGQYSFGFFVRKKIFDEHKEELISAINQDLKDELERVKRELHQSYERYR